MLHYLSKIMKTKTITEGKAIIAISDEKKLSKKVNIFYNPIMKTNRDLSIAVLNALERNNLQIADLFAASGVRSIRFLRELPKNKIKQITINDYSLKAIQQLKKNLKQNKLEKNEKIEIKNKEATLLLLQSNGFDYIDLDPFGTPVSFLDAACKRIARDGIIAVTATDTGALAGAFPDACRRKYGSTPLRCSIMHEIGLRILIKKCQEVGAQYDKALTPLLSYAKDHYMRIFFLCKKGKTKANEIVRQHKIIKIENNDVGLLWTGTLWDEAFVKRMKTEEKETEKFLETIKKEVSIEQVGFYDIHALCKKNKIAIPQYIPLMEAIKNAGYDAARTHFSVNGIKSAIDEETLLKLMQEL